MDKGYNKRSLNQIAQDYFDYLGRHLPQQCASDEFYFLPRSETAIQYLNNLDDLTPEGIQDHLRYVRGLLREIPATKLNDLEMEIDRALLKGSMESFVREFGDDKVWRRDPTLYPKILIFAMDQVLFHLDTGQGQMREGLTTLFNQIPSFLNQSAKNLGHCPEIAIKAAVDMTQDIVQLYAQVIPTLIQEKTGRGKDLRKGSKEILESLEQFNTDLLYKVSSRRRFAVGENTLKRILSVSMGYPRSMDEILKICKDGYREIQGKIHSFARKIDRHRSWKQIIYDYLPSLSSHVELLRLYKKELKGLRRFFYSQDIVPFPPKEDVPVRLTPFHLKSLRATAFYRAPLTGDIHGQGVFYVNPGEDDLGLIARHCPYLSAHETYPGHHILDQFRINNPNPIRRQIEAPLFYEGWACYAEQLLDELGYVTDPRQQLVQLKRQLWRALRARLDVELQTEGITLKQAAREIESLGFSPNAAQRQAHRFALTPGYQLCYFMGMREILRLRRRFASIVGLKTFHDILLTGGQLPFHLVERRLEAL